jgi:hypothetical protein
MARRPLPEVGSPPTPPVTALGTARANERYQQRAAV